MGSKNTNTKGLCDSKEEVAIFVNAILEFLLQENIDTTCVLTTTITQEKSGAYSVSIVTA
jgi:hypothetical protein